MSLLKTPVKVITALVDKVRESLNLINGLTFGNNKLKKCFVKVALTHLLSCFIDWTRGALLFS